MSKYVEKIGLPCTAYNAEPSENYAKIFNIKTHIANSNVSIDTPVFDTKALLLFNVFSFTANTFSQTNLIIRLKTSENKGNNVFITKVPSNFKIVYTVENDGSYTFYVKCNSNERVKFQLIEGFDGFVNYYYDSPFDITLSDETVKEPNIINEHFGNDGTCSIKVNPTNTGIIIDTVVGGDGFIPSRDSSIPLGSSTKRFKGGYFTEQIAMPAKVTGTPANPINGTTFFHATSKKLVTYYNGKWYCNGEEATIS